jgi:hypothetical protein
MFMQPLLAAVPSGVLDMTADFAPLFVGMVVGVCVGVLALAFAIGVHDTQSAQRQVKKRVNRPSPFPDWPEAA